MCEKRKEGQRDRLGNGGWRTHKIKIEECIFTRSLLDQGWCSILFYHVRIINLNDPLNCFTCGIRACVVGFIILQLCDDVSLIR